VAREPQSTTWIARPEGEEAWLTRVRPSSVVADRTTWLAGFVEGKRVAHVGFADVGCERSNQALGRWVHAAIAESAGEAIGLDIDATAVAAANARGYAAYAVDCTDPNAVQEACLGTFDCVIYGEVIEHVENTAGLFAGAELLLSPGGSIVITTPNARRLADVVLALAGREVIHPDHVALHSARTLVSVLGRHGWFVAELLTYLNPPPSPRTRRPKEYALRGLHALERCLARTVAPYIADGLIVVARRTEDSV